MSFLYYQIFWNPDDICVVLYFHNDCHYSYCFFHWSLVLVCLHCLHRRWSFRLVYPCVNLLPIPPIHWLQKMRMLWTTNRYILLECNRCEKVRNMSKQTSHIPISIYLISNRYCETGAVDRPPTECPSVVFFVSALSWTSIDPVLFLNEQIQVIGILWWQAECWQIICHSVTNNISPEWRNCFQQSLSQLIVPSMIVLECNVRGMIFSL